MARHYDLIVIQEDSKRRQRAESSDRRMQTASLIGESRRSCAEFINPLRCFGLCQGVIEILTGFSTQRLQVRALRIGHRFLASFPFVRVALQRRLSGIIR